MVEWKKLGEICEIGTGANNREDACDDGLYPFFVRSQEVLRINEYLFNEESILIPGEGGIGDIFHYFNGKYGLHQRTYRVHPISDSVYGKYIYYYLFANFKCYINKKSYKSTAASIRKPMLTDFPISIPSLSEQQRIVSILDTFTSSISNLKQQIEERRKQYEYERDLLLDLEGKEGVEMKKLGEVGDICMCKRIMKDQTSEKGDIPFFKIGTFGGKADAYISRELFEDYKEKYSYPKKGEILISAAGTIGRTVVFNGEDAYFQDSNIVWISNNEQLVLNTFLRYLYGVIDWKIDGGTIKRLYNYNLKNATIYVPTLQAQSRIVSILDTFEQSISNLEEQLAMREKQYEYYRNQLLTFEGEEERGKT